MRAVRRGTQAAPASLESRNREQLTELERARVHQQSTDPTKGSFAFAAYKGDDVKRRLEALFHGKCAYCETPYSASAPVDIEHYRPKGAVSEDAQHPGYWWLAMRWDNLLPSCIDCNRRRRQQIPLVSTSLEELYNSARANDFAMEQAGKKDSFPIAATGHRLLPELSSHVDEEPLLLDPTRDEPDEHLHFHIDATAQIGLVLPGNKDGKQSTKGSTSIQVYGLNRLGLVQDRTRLLRRLEFLGYLAIELGELVQEITQPAVSAVLKSGKVSHVPQRLRMLQSLALAEMREMADPGAPYSAMVRAWLDAFADRLSPGSL